VKPTQNFFIPPTNARLFISVFLIALFSFVPLKRPETGDHAIVKARLIVITPGGNQESSTQLFLTPLHVKLVSESNVLRSWLFYDSLKKQVTVLTQTLGRSLGYRMPFKPNYADQGISVNYIDSAKTIANIEVRKAIITDSAHEQNEVEVWYAPRLNFANQTLGINLKGFHLVKGLPMQFSTRIQGITLQYTVESLDLTTAVADSEFDIPPGFDISDSYDDYMKKMTK